MPQPSDITKHRTLNLYGPLGPSDPVEPPEERCADCGTPLTVVRPGKSQCDNPDCVFNQVERPRLRGIPADLVTYDDAGFFDPTPSASRIAKLEAALRITGKCHNCRGSGFILSNCSEPHPLGVPCPEPTRTPCSYCNQTGLTAVARDALQ